MLKEGNFRCCATRNSKRYADLRYRTIRSHRPLLARFKILHEPLKVRIVPDQPGSSQHQPVNLFIGEIERRGDSHQ